MKFLRKADKPAGGQPAVHCFCLFCGTGSVAGPRSEQTAVDRSCSDR